jgi:hypothetical protein
MGMGTTHCTDHIHTYYCGTQTRCWIETSKRMSTATAMQQVDKQTPVSKQWLRKHVPAEMIPSLSLGNRP